MNTKLINAILVLCLILITIPFIHSDNKTVKQVSYGYNYDLIENADGSYTQKNYNSAKNLDRFVNLTDYGDDLLLKWSDNEILIRLIIKDKSKKEKNISDQIKEKSDFIYKKQINYSDGFYKFGWLLKQNDAFDFKSITIELVDISKKEKKIKFDNKDNKYYFEDGLIIDFNDLVLSDFTLIKETENKNTIDFTGKTLNNELYLDPSITIDLTKNTYLMQGNPNDNYGIDGVFVIDDAQIRRAVFQAPITTIPENSTISSATLSIRTSTTSTTQNVEAYALKEAWTEIQTTWNNKTSTSLWSNAGGTYNTTLISTTPVSSAGWYDIDISKAFRWWNNGYLTDNGLILLTEDGSSHTYFSDDASDSANRPYYSITYTRPSPKISLISPSNNSINLTSRTVDFKCNATVLPNCSSCNITYFDISYSTDLENFYTYKVANRTWDGSDLSQPNKTASFNWTTTIASDGVYYWHCTIDVSYVDGTTVSLLWDDDYKLTIDTVYPNITFGTNTPNDGTNSTSSNLFINVSVQEPTPSNITYTIYNDSGLYNSSTYSMINQYSNISKNFTLNDGNYTYNVTVRDIVGHVNYTSTRRIRVDTKAPNLVLKSPLNLQEFNYNTSININYSVSDAFIGLNSCVYSLDGATNVTLPNCANVTINVSDASHTLKLCANDTFGNTNCTSTITFSISLDAPSITLNYPLNGSYHKNGTNFYLNYTATDSNGLSACQVWHNFDGTFKLNQTNSGITSGLMNFTVYNISEGNYLWNIFCNDTSNNGRFSTNNKTFIIDLTLPSVSINSPVTTTAGSQTIKFTDVTSDTYLSSCKYSIYNSSGSIDGLYENISKTCNSETTAIVSGYSTFTVRSYALDLANNENYDEETFTTTASSPTAPGGGGGGSSPESSVVIIQQPSNITSYNQLERAILYARIRETCLNKTDCKISDSNINVLLNTLQTQGVIIVADNFKKFLENYNLNLLESAKLLDSDVKNFNLFTGVLTILESELKITPSKLDPFITFILFSNKFQYEVKSNKELKNATIISGDKELSVILTGPSSANIVLNIDNITLSSKVYTATASYVDNDGNTKYQDINIRTLNLKNAGTVTFIVISIVGVSTFFYIRKRKKTKTGGSIF